MKNSLKIGQIVNVHGIKGEVKIYPYTDDVDHLCTLQQIFFDEALTQKQKITSCRVHKGMLIMKLKDMDTVEQAQKLRQTYLYIPRPEREALEEDEYYIEDLIGLQVVDIEDNPIGILTYVMSTGANDVYEVKTEDKGTIYLPAIHQVIKKVDMEHRKMYVELMEGLV